MSECVVVDASVAFKWLVREEHSDAADALGRMWARQGTRMTAPYFMPVEVANILHRRVVGNEVSVSKATSRPADDRRRTEPGGPVCLMSSPVTHDPGNSAPRRLCRRSKIPLSWLSQPTFQPVWVGSCLIASAQPPSSMHTIIPKQLRCEHPLLHNLTALLVRLK